MPEYSPKMNVELNKTFYLPCAISVSLSFSSGLNFNIVVSTGIRCILSSPLFSVRN